MAYGQGGWRRGRRNMYYLTGMPGWMRFGYPSWWMGSPAGMPAAQSPLQAGQIPQPYSTQTPAQISVPSHENCANYRDGFCTLYGIPIDPNTPVCPNFTPKNISSTPQMSSTPPTFQVPVGFPQAQMSKDQEIQMLEGQARMVEQQLELIKKRLEELKKEVR